MGFLSAAVALDPRVSGGLGPWLGLSPGAGSMLGPHQSGGM